MTIINLAVLYMFNLFYYKPKNRTFLEILENSGVDKPQNYIPIYQRFFDLNDTNYNSISFNHKNHIVDFEHVYDTITGNTIDVPIFIKYSPVLDPIHYMMGKYNVKDPRMYNLPQLHSTDVSCYPKILDTNNSSYIDGFFTFLTSILLHNHGVFHGVDYYGSFMGIQKRFSINVIEELEHLDGSDFFHNNLNKLFEVDNFNEGRFFCNNSRNCKSRLQISDENADIDCLDIEVITEEPKPNIDDVFSNGDFTTITVESDNNTSINNNIQNDLDIDIEPVPVCEPVSEVEIEYEKSSDSSIENESDDSSSLNYTTDDDTERQDDIDDLSIEELDDSCDDDGCDDDEDDGEGDEDDDDMTDVFAYIYNFPVNMICMEKCSGTLDSLMNHLTEDEWRSALFQVTMILLIYQKTFYLTHNDLHTNNIMYIETKHKYIYYTFEGITYKVPTFGRIYKIIDYGRAIYTFSGRLFCSDSFDFNGDASTQYNFPPYYNDKKPIVEPNYSFDLCRLGCSIYDFVFENENDAPRTEFEKLILEWCTDEKGKNIMYKKNGEERYLDFKLYKMIARTVHNHTPYDQLKREFFSKYKVFGKNTNSSKSLCLNIDIIPCYAKPTTADNI